MSPGDYGPGAQSAADGSASRFEPFPVPPHAVNATDQAVAAQYGLPPRPGDDAPPALKDMWDRIFGKPLTPIAFVPPAVPLVEAAFRIVRRELAVRSSGGHAEDSGNWAGAYATANSGMHLGTMLGIWKVPLKLTVPNGRDPRDFSCSIWIGLDGQRRYFDSSLPQIGTLTQFNADGSRNDFAWVQWWERDSPGNSFATLPVPVKPGDEVGAFLHVVDPLHVWLVLVNLSTSPVRTATALKVSAPVGGAQPILFGATAEWVVERPSRFNLLKSKFDLPDFGHCHMEGLALQTTQIGDILYNGELRDMSYARMIRMLEVRTDPPRTAIIAMPHRAGPTAVNVTFGGF